MGDKGTWKYGDGAVQAAASMRRGDDRQHVPACGPGCVGKAGLDGNVGRGLS